MAPIDRHAHRRHHAPSRARPPAALLGALGALIVLVIAGCGIGPGSTEVRDVELTVTRDFGEAELVSVTEEEGREADTVLRLLDRHAEIETRHGGGFVQSIDGVAGTGPSGGPDGRFLDWFFYVNGIESGEGAAAVEVNEGDRIWWDRREWTAAMRVPAVVGSYPEPFAHGLEGKAFPTRIDCLGERSDCEAVAGALQEEGVAASVAAERVRAGHDLLRVIVGPWEAVRQDRDARPLADGPEVSGVFAAIDEDGGEAEIALFDGRGHERDRLGAGTGLIAAVGTQGPLPAWVVTGTDAEGVRAATRRLTREDLRNAYAMAVDGGEPVRLPVQG